MLGYSSGASLAQAAAKIAPEHGLDVQRSVFAEPPNVATRSLFELMKQFMRSGAQLDSYIDQADSRPLNEATRLARDDIGYMAGLARPSNVAIAHALGLPTYGGLVKELVEQQPGLGITTVVASESKISGFAAFQSIEGAGGAALSRQTGVMILEGAHHAAADDIDLHAAMMLQGLTLAE